MTLRELLILHEGYRKKPYLCPAGKRSIGIGHNISANGLPPHIAAYLDAHGEITDEMIDTLYQADEYAAECACRRIYDCWDSIDEVRQMALIDFVFNVGAGTAETFIATNAAIELGQWEQAAHCMEDSKYYRQLGGDQKGTDDGKMERPERIIHMIRTGKMP